MSGLHIPQSIVVEGNMLQGRDKQGIAATSPFFVQDVKAVRVRGIAETASCGNEGRSGCLIQRWSF